MIKQTQLAQAAQSALSAWEGWNGLGVAGRAQLLQHFVAQLEQEQASMAQWQIDQALRLIDAPLEMPGPTGESNLLSTSGRGLFIIAAEQQTGETALVGQLVAALISGNVVLLAPHSSQSGFCRDLLRQLVAGSCPAAVAQLLEGADSVLELSQCPSLAGIACVCDAGTARELNRQLCERTGVLVQLVAETDPARMPLIGSEQYLYRFITEQVCSTNTTAVGGNATLLELGGQAE
ncbi:1-pyrroline-5-carboxylate dehydrogenase [Marinobacterium rhizophilum]|uniref:1-pyrroline-5-carboxylate dehydrogenase n=1 Tax=Marinobacterium rhizophilum TaxID=420402 RepID=A0ABY5HFV7_9GAMM|nr:1-pyrroline-5-carboxylate dehydrogenase [Marinobacterium rhizophilum]UTW10473.1 1-pyrroline-5-carboxylate dehydrogenase [Marinobacterium rhizophilum]